MIIGDALAGAQPRTGKLKAVMRESEALHASDAAAFLLGRQGVDPFLHLGFLRRLCFRFFAFFGLCGFTFFGLCFFSFFVLIVWIIRLRFLGGGGSGCLGSGFLPGLVARFP